MRGTIGTGGHLGGLLQLTPPDVTPEQEDTVPPASAGRERRRAAPRDAGAGSVTANLSKAVYEAKRKGQHRSLWPLTDQCRDDFHRIVADVPVGAYFHVNSIRDELDAAQIPDKARGGLMAGAMKAGLCEEVRERIPGLGYVVWHVPSTGARTNASGVKVYRRTTPRKE